MTNRKLNFNNFQRFILTMPDITLSITIIHKQKQNNDYSIKSFNKSAVNQRFYQGRFITEME